MKILMVCNGGLSTGMLAKKIKTYAQENNLNVEAVEARGMGDYSDIYKEFDVILLGPQISNLKKDVEKETGKPVTVIAPMDYARSNVSGIMEQIKQLLNQQ